MPSSSDPDVARWNKARADQAETKAERDRAELLERNGTWVEAAAVKREWARRLGELLTMIEGEFPGMAEALVQQRDIKGMTVELRRQFRGVRERLATRFG